VAGPGVAFAQPRRREQRAVPWHAAAIPGAAGLPEKAPDGYFRVSSESPLAGCQGLHSTCRGRPPPRHQLLGRHCSCPHPSLPHGPPSAAGSPRQAPKAGTSSSLGCLRPAAGLTRVSLCELTLPASPGTGAKQASPWRAFPGAAGGSGDGQPELSPAVRG